MGVYDTAAAAVVAPLLLLLRLMVIVGRSVWVIRAVLMMRVVRMAGLGVSSSSSVVVVGG